MPKGYLIGTKTFGATGARADGDDSDYPNSLATNSGSFTVETVADSSADYLRLTVIEAGTEFKGADGRNYEGVGLEPNKVAPFSRSDFRNGIDDQLQAALNYIDGKL
jgi:hypothetical protein